MNVDSEGLHAIANTEKRFRVALSFSGTIRDYVKQVADNLAERFTEERVLYDRYHTAEFANTDLAFDLPDLYKKDSDLIVAFLSGKYVESEWCGLEWRAIFSLVKSRQTKKVMLFRADDAEIPGLHDLEGFIPLNGIKAIQAVEYILQRLAVNEGKARDFYLNGNQTISSSDSVVSTSRLPRKHDSGVFEGRDGVLADLDGLWADAVAEKEGRARIVSLVAIGGAGKTTVARRWKQGLLGQKNHGGVERYFDWSFYSQGLAKEGTHVEATATAFIDEALKFFGDEKMAKSNAPGWDKGAKLAHLVAEHRTLLVLDGLEPLQHPPGPQQGELKDDGLKALLSGLQSYGRGLCVITTREPVKELCGTENTGTPCWQLDHLTDQAGAAVLNGHGVTGPQEELDAASREVKGHALTLSLMGRYLKMAHRSDPDIARRDRFHFQKADAKTQNGHAFRVFAAYEKWFQEEDQLAELAILRLLGLFDRPATPDCIDALCKEPPIPGLTEPLVDLSEEDWEFALSTLIELDLIETQTWSPTERGGYGEDIARRAKQAACRHEWFELDFPQIFGISGSAFIINRSLDAHPLLREYFETRLKAMGVASEAHGRLYDHLCASVPYWPEGRKGLEPLYQAVAHGCKAGRYQAACDDVYHDRILRGTQGSQSFYSRNKLGLLGVDLATVACFFLEPWRKLAPELKPGDQAWLLSEAAFCLRGLNRLREAREAMRTHIAVMERRAKWKYAAMGGQNLSGLELTLGNVLESEETATRSIEFAKRSDDAFWGMANRAMHADALHQAGKNDESRELFVQAEAMQEKESHEHPLLYSLRGYQYCDLLLGEAERAAWRVLLSPPPFQGGVRGGPEPSLECSTDTPVCVSPTLTSPNPSSERKGTGEAPDKGGWGDCEKTLDAVESRATQLLAWSKEDRRSILEIALAHLTLGRVHLLRAAFRYEKDSQSGETAHQCDSARTYLETALAMLRQCSRTDHLPRALLPCAWMHVLAGEPEAAKDRLDEAYGIATRGGDEKNGWIGGMRLFLADKYLYRARLFMGCEQYPWPGRTGKDDLDAAEELIKACGYHRRDEELADARQALNDAALL